MMTEDECAALERLIRVAQGDSGQSRRVADFLLAWWNAASCGGFDITTAWGVDSGIVEDMVIVFRFAAHASTYPDTLGYEGAFRDIVCSCVLFRRRLHQLIGLAAMCAGDF